MNRPNERATKIVQEYAKYDSWEDRYKAIIARGKAAAPLEDLKKTEEAKVRGCQSQVWLHAKLTSENEIEFEADSDAMIVKGLVSILVDVYNKSLPEEILAHSPQFLNELGFQTHLSPSRANGLNSMLKQIRNFAIAFQTLLNMKQQAQPKPQSKT